MRKRWSEEELVLFRQNYPYMDKKELLKLFPERSSDSISHKANRLNLTKEIRWWSEEELETLKSCYSNLSKEELFRVLPKKDWTSIRHKAEELGLKLDYKRWYKRNWKIFENTNLVLSDVDKGYLAGIIDGEGTVSIVRAINKSNKEVHTYYAPIIYITNTDPKLMSRVREIVKVGHFHSEKQRNPNHKTKLVYSVASIRGVKMILEQIINVLTTKKRNAERVLEFIRIKETKTERVITPREIVLYKLCKKLAKAETFNKTN